MNGFDQNPHDAGTTPGPTTTPASDTFTGSTASSGEPYSAGAYGPSTGYGAPGSVPPPPQPGLPNPALATFLGFIPGVGAMYNGQFAKGLAHIVIFAVLVSLADHVNNIFGLLVTGWIFYMVFDAYQTARARRDGLQIPDPFGLNNIGERMGVGNGPNWSDFTAKPAPGQAPAQPRAPYGENPGTYTTGFQGTEAPAYTAYPGSTSTGQPVPPTPPYGVPPPPAAYGTSYDASSPYGAPPPYASQPPYTVPPSAPFGTYAAPYAPPVPPLPQLASGLPMGAFWLIGFGVLALIGTLSHRFYWSSRYLDGFIVTVVGVVLLVTRTLRARTVYPAGTAAAAWYILRSARVGLILVAIGAALTLDHAGWITWEYVWPYLLILLGVFLLLERAAHNRMLAAGPIPPVDPASPFETPQPTSNSAVPSILPRDEEGR